MEDLLKKIWLSLNDRFNNNFLFAFFSSWLVTNYKIFFVLFSSDSYDKKFGYVDSYLSNHQNMMYLVYLPLLVAIFYTVVWPLIDICLIWIVGKISHIKALVIINLDKKTPISKEERSEFFKKYEHHLSECRAIIKTHNLEMDNTKRSTEELERELRTRLFDQAYVRLGESAGLTSEEVFQLFQQGTTDARINTQAKQMYHLPILKKFRRFADSLPTDDQARKICTIEKLAQELGLSGKITSELLPIFYTLGLATDLSQNSQEYAGKFEIVIQTHHEFQQIDKVIQLLDD